MIGKRWFTAFIIALILSSAMGAVQQAEAESFLDRLARRRSQRVAESFVHKSPTFVFDGISDSLATTGAVEAACDNCWTVTIDFQCAHDGYGDRSDQVPAPVITDHTATVRVVQYKVVEADLDGKWDMVNQQTIAPPWQPSPEQLKSLVDGHTAFALDLYRRLAQEPGNLFFSPYSISTAMGMAFAGARGHTEAEIASAFHYNLPQAELHPTIRALGDALDSRGQHTGTANDGSGFELSTVQSAWSQEDFGFETAYQDILVRSYGSPLQSVDFVDHREEARTAINEWVARHTGDRIEELIEKGVLTNETILVLVNAIYFLAQWELPFDADATADQPFYKLDGTTTHVPMMRQTQRFKYMQTDGWKAVELAYDGGEISMVVILPENGQFESVQSSMDPAFLAAVTEGLSPWMLELGVPRFSLKHKCLLSKALAAMGMETTFIPGAANFYGMNASHGDLIWLQEVIHEAVVDVDESGTEAAAATAVVVGGGCDGGTSGTVMTIDRPFIFMIRDLPTNTILFMGRVLDPLQ